MKKQGKSWVWAKVAFGWLMASLLIATTMSIGSADAGPLLLDCMKTEDKEFPCTKTPTDTPTDKPTSVSPSDTPKPTILAATNTPTDTPKPTSSSAPIVTFTPTISPSSSPTLTQTFELPEPLYGGETCGDIWIQGIEVTQGIQVYPGNLVPLVSFKRTVVRVYVQSNTDCGGPWNSVTARLIVTSGPYAGDVLLPVTSSSRGTISVSTAGSNRQSLTDSFNFILPVWLTFTGSRDLQATIFSTDLRAEDPDNNQMAMNLRFRAASSRTTYAVAHGNCVVPTGYSGGAPVTTRVIDAARPLSEIEPARLFVQNMMPTYQFFLRPLPGNPTPCFPSDSSARSDQRANAWAMREIDRACPEGGCYLYVYSPRIPVGTSQSGWCCNTTALGNKVYDGTPFAGNSPGYIMGQEFFHSFIRNNLHTFDTAFGFPWSNNTIGQQVGLRTSGGSGIAGLEIRRPTEGDVMSYNGSPAWISPFTYCLLLEALNSINCPAGAPTSSLEMPLVLRGSKGSAAPNISPQVGLYVQVAGAVTANGLLTVEPLRIVASARDLTSLPETGAYTLTFQGAEGASLAEYHFDLNPGTHHPDEIPAEDETTPFFLVVPYPLLATRMLFSLGPDLQAELVRSASAPVVSLLSPSIAGSLTGNQTITWEASDADEISTLSYDVDYSPDSGETWLPLGSYIAETSLEVDFDSVPGGEDVLLRVTASDGWNIGIDMSDLAFSVPSHSPEIMLVELLDGASFFETQPFYAEAIAFDWEDGPITNLDSYTWISDIDGVLSTGPWAALAEMTPGDHTLTVEVLDSDGNVSKVSVHVTILDVEELAQEPVLEGAVQPQSNLIFYVAAGLGALTVVVLLVRRSRRVSKK